ncbi:hypothetical protein BHU72_03315 [Desulfuribacillus stibiiarsenatis]|uniref:Flagellar hook-length control protein-like C-terminal domain-containing protein n=1 Tax=Desulfuribacillus stibiiarsenatis TaxID=1390249 RepID=A0A1E5L776_9FIRM|nr:flagellar hook-length control protein FliK [Desulfuribacillus stibiiarsenatis]OEH85823.1 hypothetical protein BHU72_03315 [Desulfuribacillus stibiiarsenatis]
MNTGLNGLIFTEVSLQGANHGGSSKNSKALTSDFAQLLQLANDAISGKQGIQYGEDMEISVDFSMLASLISTKSSSKESNVQGIDFAKQLLLADQLLKSPLLYDSHEMNDLSMDQGLAAFSREELKEILAAIQQLLTNDSEETLKAELSKEEFDLATKNFGDMHSLLLIVETVISHFVERQSNSQTPQQQEGISQSKLQQLLFANPNHFFKNHPIVQTNSNSPMADMKFAERIVAMESNATSTNENIIKVLKQLIHQSETNRFKLESQGKVVTQAIAPLLTTLTLVQPKLVQVETTNLVNQDVKLDVEGVKLTNNLSGSQQQWNSSEESQSKQSLNVLSSLDKSSDNMGLNGFSSILGDSAKATTVSNTTQINYTSQSEFENQLQELMLNQAKLVKKPNGIQSMVVSLQPAHLGALKISITSHQGHMTASIITTTNSAREMIEGSINNLRIALVNQGITIDKIDVQHQTSSSNSNVTQSASAQSQLFQQRKEQETQYEQQNKKNKQSERFSFDELEELALDFINENQIDKKFIHNNDYSTSINITA